MSAYNSNFASTEGPKRLLSLKEPTARDGRGSPRGKGNYSNDTDYSGKKRNFSSSIENGDESEEVKSEVYSHSSRSRSRSLSPSSMSPLTPYSSALKDVHKSIVDLLKRTHPSSFGEFRYYGSSKFEDMEFLGDAVLHTELSLFLIKSKAVSGPKLLTTTRIAAEKNKNLALLFEDLNLSKLMIKASNDDKGFKWKADVVECLIGELYMLSKSKEEAHDSLAHASLGVMISEISKTTYECSQRPRRSPRSDAKFDILNARKSPLPFKKARTKESSIDKRSDASDKKPGAANGSLLQKVLHPLKNPSQSIKKQKQKQKKQSGHTSVKAATKIKPIAQKAEAQKEFKINVSGKKSINDRDNNNNASDKTAKSKKVGKVKKKLSVAKTNSQKLKNLHH